MARTPFRESLVKTLPKLGTFGSTQCCGCVEIYICGFRVTDLAWNTQSHSVFFTPNKNILMHNTDRLPKFGSLTLTRKQKEVYTAPMQNLLVQCKHTQVLMGIPSRSLSLTVNTLHISSDKTCVQVLWMEESWSIKLQCRHWFDSNNQHHEQ